MDITALRSFREAYRQGSISVAAQILGYTQSAVSRQIAALETRLGTPLLERHARGVRLTSAGEVLLEHAAVILRRVEHAERDVIASREQPVTYLRVGGVPSTSAGLLPQALNVFATELPSVRVAFAEDVTPRMLPRLLDGELDVAVITDYPPGIPAYAGLALTHLLDEELMCALPEDHPLARRDVIDLADLSQDTWVEDYEGAASILSLACAQAGFTPRIDIRCGSWLGKQAFVAAGHGVMLAPGLLVPALRRDLAVRALVNPPRRSVYASVRHRPASATAAADAFVRALAQVGAEVASIHRA
ncbi:LysR family transcriptional regulator [Rhizohabitans arisaemae]|uniref:LysR family transcriptional regulator n=1 Tax=Rhizohabitans arisaemae TaxID=2720610 RepID=UPI0024B0876B|nr:LysR family transcriptional regulator [Rhizohabitans arisaemae]